MKPTEPTKPPVLTEPTGTTETTGATHGARSDQDPGEGDLLLEELLVSEVSIDGMCGVY